MDATRERVQSVLEWEEAREDSRLFQTVATEMNREFDREDMLRRTGRLTVAEEEEALLEEESEEDEEEREGPPSEVSYDSDYFPGKTSGGFFRYDEVDDVSESESMDANPSDDLEEDSCGCVSSDNEDVVDDDEEEETEVEQEEEECHGAEGGENQAQ